ncbi:MULTISPECIES: hypothetical protein [unclassified Duganella]|uniref:hypothetical protein n=1 Tax=unclassified Duganella TaxID=2636909 RepID=UPI0006FB8228|nr:MULTISPECIES: hypothetical protein [unclassified Duganella]KQV53993.1 hypothetical protein ASD07_05470 [Duganella sp. Root336D2]KRB98205.1 hypothetical protein ASE26_25145 [Duganella sp. Root198D2]
MKSLATIAFAGLCALASLAPLAFENNAGARVTAGFPGWPTSFEGRKLTPLPLTPIETRFQQNFPGRVGRFSDGEREIVIRWVDQGTRKLHASSDCFKANGYELTVQPVKIVGQERWSGFIASRGTQKLEVHERIADAYGGQWSDVSAWYWAAQLGQTKGPWWAITVAQNVGS